MPSRAPVAAGLLVLLLALLLALGGAIAPASAFASSNGPSSRSGVSAPNVGMAADLLSRVNDLRARLGLGPLVDDPAVTAIALRWSTTMALNSRLAHNPNLGAQAPPGWLKMGENVGVGESIPQLFNAFVASPRHYRNLVDPSFTRSGIAVIIDSNGELWVTQNFELAQGDHYVVPNASAASRSVTADALIPPPEPKAPDRVPDRMCFALEQLSGRGLG